MYLLQSDPHLSNVYHVIRRGSGTVVNRRLYLISTILKNRSTQTPQSSKFSTSSRNFVTSEAFPTTSTDFWAIFEATKTQKIEIKDNFLYFRKTPLDNLGHPRQFNPSSRNFVTSAAFPTTSTDFWAILEATKTNIFLLLLEEIKKKK